LNDKIEKTYEERRSAFWEIENPIVNRTYDFDRDGVLPVNIESRIRLGRPP